MYKYYILAFIIGIICKLYDDLNDADLYSYFNLQEYKEYLNEFFKSLFGLSIIVLSINFNLFYIWFVLSNIIVWFIARDDYKAYETMGIVSCIVLIPFLNWNNIQQILLTIQLPIQQILLLFTILLLISISEYYLKDNEYSYKKLILRFCTLILLILSLFINNNYQNLLNDILLIYFMSIGYLLTSCCFQYILITRDNNLLQSNKVIKEEKLENKKVKEEIT